MRGRMVVWTVAVAALALVSTARAAHDGMLDADALKQQAKQNKALSRYLKYNGYPELAEVRTIRDQTPWDDHEVTLYYLESRKEISFARARVLGRPEVHIARYERTLTDADIRALKARPGVAKATPASSGTTTPEACTGNATQRAECAANRAEKAADRVDAAAGRAETAADKTEAIVDKMAARATRTNRRKN